MARIRRGRTATNEQDMPCQLRKLYFIIFCVVNALSSKFVGPPTQCGQLRQLILRLGWGPLILAGIHFLN